MTITIGKGNRTEYLPIQFIKDGKDIWIIDRYGYNWTVVDFLNEIKDPIVTEQVNRYIKEKYKIA